MDADERFQIFDAERKRKEAEKRAREQAEVDALAPDTEALEMPAAFAELVVEVDELPQDENRVLGINAGSGGIAHVRGSYAKKLKQFWAKGRGSEASMDKRKGPKNRFYKKPGAL